MSKFLRAKGIIESLSLLLPVTLFYLIWIFIDILVLTQNQKPSTSALLWIFPGYLAWTLCEYVGHRYIEHRPMSGKRTPEWLTDWFPHLEHHQQPQNLNDIFEIHQSSLIVACAAAAFMLLSGDTSTACILHTGFNIQSLSLPSA